MDIGLFILFVLATLIAVLILAGWFGISTLRMTMMRITPLLLIVLGLVIVSWTYVGYKSDGPSTPSLSDAWDRVCVRKGHPIYTGYTFRPSCATHSKSQLGRVAQSADYLAKTYYEVFFLLGAVTFGAGVWRYRQR